MILFMVILLFSKDTNAQVNFQDVVFNNTSANIVGNLNAASLELHNANISGSGPLAVYSSFLWASGLITGSSSILFISVTLLLYYD